MSVEALRLANVRVFDGTNPTWSDASDVTMAGTTIDSITAAGTTEPDPGTVVIDGGGRCVIPGLIDAHWHVAFAAVPMLSAITANVGYTLAVAVAEAARTLDRGFTTVRDAGGPSLGVKKAIDEGVVAGPRIFPSGAFITQTSGHGDFRIPAFDLPHACGVLHHSEVNGASRIADGVDEVLRAAREQLMQGASQLKLMAGGGVSSFYDPIDVTQYTEAEMRAGVEAAENWGTYVMVHAYTPRAIQQAIRAGVRCIEHGQLADDETVAMMAEHDVWWSLQPFLDDEDANPQTNPKARAKQIEVSEGTDRAYQLAIQHGVNVAWGTDTLYSAPMAERQGAKLAKMTRWYSPGEVLVMATSGNARLLALSGERNPYPDGPLGVIEPGALADVLVIDGDPLADPQVLADPGNLAVIVKDGKVHRSALDTTRH